MTDHFCPKQPHLTYGNEGQQYKADPVWMQPINVHSEGSGSELPLYIYIGDYALRAYKCPKCGYVETYQEEVND